jgi:hypothetical protein
MLAKLPALIEEKAPETRATLRKELAVLNRLRDNVGLVAEMNDVEYGILMGRIAALTEEIPYMESFKYHGQADESSVMIGEVGAKSSDEIVQTVTFMDNQPVQFLDMSEPGDQTRGKEDLQDVNSLARFLERPRRLTEFPMIWTPGSNLVSNPATNTNFVTLDVWDILLQGAFSRKIDNFRNLRCSGIVVEMRINASPFLYGQLYASYIPGPNFMVPFQNMIPTNNAKGVTNCGTLNASQLGLKTHWSQYPGIFINPRNNAVSRLDIPFFWPANYLSMIANSPSQPSQLGRVVVWVMNPLLSASAGTLPISVSAVGWLKDPILTVPTAANAYVGEAMATRAGSGTPKGRKDEYTKGTLSVPATALSRFAGKLSSVPIIGPYATATKMAAGAFANIASLFGYSRPLVVERPLFVNQRVFGPLAITTGEDTALKLTLDPKQEITVDPRVVGLQNVDEMSFAHIMKRESLVLQVPWAQSENPSVNLAHIIVHPGACPESVVGTVNPIRFHTALSWATLPFQYWRGTLHYRIQIVASQMHKGRLAVVYSPSRAAVGNTLPDTASTFQHIIDLSECVDYTFKVRYAQNNPWQLMHGTGQIAGKGAVAFPAESLDCSNGILSLYVFTRLAVPIGTADCTINVFVSAGDDFQVAVPSDEADLEFSSPFAQPIRVAYSGEALTTYVGQADEGGADYMVKGESQPITQHKDVILNGNNDDIPDVSNENLVYFGEQVVSLRALLKRYCLYRRYNLSAQSSSNVGFRLDHPHVPMWPGVSVGTPTGVGTIPVVNPNLPMGNTDVNGSFNYVRNTYLNYYRSGFAAYRGNIRYKYIVRGPVLTESSGASVMVSRRPNAPSTDVLFATTTVSNPIGAIAATQDAKQQAMYTDPLSTSHYCGAEIAFTQLKNGIEFEHPYYSPQRFAYTMMRPVVGFVNRNSILFKQYIPFLRSRHSVSFYAASGTVQQEYGVSADVYVAAGEDFSLHYFCAAPVLCKADFTVSEGVTAPEEQSVTPLEG